MGIFTVMLSSHNVLHALCCVENTQQEVWDSSHYNNKFTTRKQTKSNTLIPHHYLSILVIYISALTFWVKLSQI